MSSPVADPVAPSYVPTCTPLLPKEESRAPVLVSRSAKALDVVLLLVMVPEIMIFPAGSIRTALPTLGRPDPTSKVSNPGDPAEGNDVSGLPADVNLATRV